MHALTPTTTAAAAAPAHPLSSACCLDMHQCRREALALAVRRDNTMDGGMGWRDGEAADGWLDRALSGAARWCLFTNVWSEATLNYWWCLQSYILYNKFPNWRSVCSLSSYYKTNIIKWFICLVITFMCKAPSAVIEDNWFNYLISQRHR